MLQKLQSTSLLKRKDNYNEIKEIKAQYKNELAILQSQEPVDQEKIQKLTGNKIANFFNRRKKIGIPQLKEVEDS